ncbi:type II toxin-antitoxin system RelE/ParE family toxin [Pseudomonas lactucae]|nr:type II toxin-antitoxin system RelE/ParE family toxin [Pseudomonas lactucae]
MSQWKPLLWVGGSKKDLQLMPGSVQDIFGFALHLAQEGSKHPQTKALKGFGGNAVLEIVEDYDGNAYRGVHTVRFDSALYVLHCFQKKSTKGIATTQHDIQLIKQRLKAAQDHAEASKGD